MSDSDQPNSISFTLERKLYLDGIELFNHHEFFEAHEFWVDIWRMAYGLKHDFYQGIIQCSVALEHYNRSNPRGVLSLFESYQRKFIHVPPIFMGLDVKKFLREMHEILRPVIEANPVPARGEITLDVSKAPKYELLYDPFETGEAQKYDRPGKF
jgi:predicted metal-dependent hydrolase